MLISTTLYLTPSRRFPHLGLAYCAACEWLTNSPSVKYRFLALFRAPRNQAEDTGVRHFPEAEHDWKRAVELSVEMDGPLIGLSFSVGLSCTMRKGEPWRNSLGGQVSRQSNNLPEWR